MAAQPYATSMLPRLVSGRERTAAAWNVLALLATALVGVGLVHLLAYHIPFGVPLGPRWVAAAVALLAHCPLAGPLGVIVAVAVLAPLLACRELLRLERLATSLTDLSAARRLPPPPSRETLPRSPRRLAVFALTLLGPQTALFALAGVICPMQGTMLMNGAPMTVPMTPALPLGPLHLVVALALALVLWRVERRLTRLRTQIAHRLELLALCPIVDRAPLPAPRAARLPLGWYGAALFARPPPLA